MRWEGLDGVAERPRVMIEVPRGSFVKRRPDGSRDFVAPLPCPYNYGSVLDTLAPDGDPFDAIVLGARLERGEIVTMPVRAVMGFVDAGVADPKLVCAAGPLTAAQTAGIAGFFRAYARFKSVVNLLRGAGRPTRALGWLDPV
ncbi:MAG TPA: inorganic diphosphatase [Nannocystaceae bacterium]|nr:inorganic diphosphatase [Nannocystaceae bacterium]